MDRGRTGSAGRVIGAEARAALLAWFERSARDLPWRRRRSPWRVVVSEFLLQQTRVATVASRFEPFLERFPDPGAMARAGEAAVVEAWAGLGYYARARALFRLAVALDARGGVPCDFVALRGLPGLGPYTAGAVASLAFGHAVPAVDGNVERVLCRVFAFDQDPRRPLGRRALHALATALVAAEHGRAATWNEALIELGATVCTSRRPACGACPLASACAGREDPERFPPRRAKAAPRPMRCAIALVHVGGELLWTRRAPGGLLGGLWEPPRADDLGALVALLGALGVTAPTLTRVGAIRHVMTHRRLEGEVYEAVGRLVAAEPSPPYDAVDVAGPDRVGASALGRKAAALARLSERANGHRRRRDHRG